MTSDDFFRSQGRLLERGIDVALLDGLHTYDQTLRDVLNTLPRLKPGGVIVIHDCNPATELAATPAPSYEHLMERMPGWCGDWNGDVWKVMVHLRSLRPDLEAVVLDCDYGIGVIRRGPVAETLPFSESQIADMQFADLERSRHELLGLRPPDYIWEMVKTCPAAGISGPAAAQNH